MFFKIVFFTFCTAALSAFPAAATPSVVVSTAPLHSIVGAVMDGAGEPQLLLPPTVSVHDFHLKPSDMRHLSSADIVFWGGPALETGLIKALQAAGKQDQSIAVLESPELTVYPARGDHYSETDGHFWLDPLNMAAAAFIAAQKLAKADPENAALYQENAQRLQSDMAALKSKGKKILAPFKNRPYVVFHDAYQYLEKSLGLSSLGALFIDPHHAAGAARISDVREKIKNKGTVCLFSEPQFSDKRIKAAAEGLPVLFGELDPSGSAVSPGKNFYPALMENLYRSLAECLSRLPAE
ncbi:MAG: zinc ABC transporter substrate-binding protein [Alphaproteobacteria bacterium]|nr:zinc ABC transporter substrate-binding protein [Alphaproteobacteria bacterium]